MFAQDRDLLAIDPTLFTTVSFSSQTLIRGSCIISNGLLKLSEQSLNFDTARISAGHVIVVDTLPLEVLSRVDKYTLQVSLLRPLPSDLPQLPADRESAPCLISTFAPQLQLAHAELLGHLDLRASETLINWRDFVCLEGLYALRHILAAAGLFASSTAGADALRQSLTARLTVARQGLAALIDTNGDGFADTVRALQPVSVVRG
jgi:hypothetical protein